jgi:hypothetical protein
VELVFRAQTTDGPYTTREGLGAPWRIEDGILADAPSDADGIAATA